MTQQTITIPEDVIQSLVKKQVESIITPTYVKSTAESQIRSHLRKETLLNEIELIVKNILKDAKENEESYVHQAVNSFIETYLSANRNSIYTEFRRNLECSYYHRLQNMICETDIFKNTVESLLTKTITKDSTFIDYVKLTVNNKINNKIKTISNTLSESISTDMVKEYMKQYTKRRDIESTEKNV